MKIPHKVFEAEQRIYWVVTTVAEHLLWSKFSEMVRIRTILQISVRIRSEFARKVRIFQFLSLSLPKNLEKEDLAWS